MNLLQYFRCFWDEWNFLYWEDSDEGLKRRRRIRSVKANGRPRAAGKASESEIHRRCYRAAMPEPSHLLTDDACLAPFGDLLKKFGFGCQGDGTPFAGNGVGATIAELLRETWAHCAASGWFSRTWHGKKALAEPDCAFGLIGADRAEHGDLAHKSEGAPLPGQERHDAVRVRKGDVGDLGSQQFTVGDCLLLAVKLEPGKFFWLELVGPDAMDIGTPSTVHLTQLGAGIGPIIARELHGGGESCNWGTIHVALYAMLLGNKESPTVEGGRWTRHGNSGVLRGGLGYFFLWRGGLYGRPDLLRESKLAVVTAMCR